MKDFINKNKLKGDITMSMKKGQFLAGGSSERGREKDDFYATYPSSVKALLDIEFFNIDNNTFLEPCVGMGHIANTIKPYYPQCEIVGMDIVDRGWNGTIVSNFLNHDFNGVKFGNIVTNPPFSLAQEFVQKSIDLLDEDGKCAMFLKIQFLESKSRKEFFKIYPPKKVLVFSDRQATMKEGRETDENGKKWSSTMCFAWFVWEKGFKGKPIIEWL